MGREIVEHQDVARSQRRHEHLFDVGQETRTIDRPIEYGWRAKTLEAQRGDHGVRLPVTAGRVIADPRTRSTSSEIKKDRCIVTCEREDLTRASGSQYGRGHRVISR